MRFAELAPGTRGSRFSDRRQNFSVQIQLEKLARESIDHVDIFLADIQRARQARVLNFANVFAILVENLDSLILAIGDPQQSFGVDSDAMRDIELPRLGSFAAPGFDEGSVLVELED